MCKTDPENIIGKIELFVNDLELFRQEDEQSARIPNISDHLKGMYEGQARAWKFCATWLKDYLEGRA